MSVVPPRVVVPGLLLVAVFLGGCSSLSGVGGDAQYACPAPQGVQCGSVTANYLRSVRDELPGQPPTGRVDAQPDRTGAAPVTAARTASASAGSAAPLYAPPRILKLWVAPWEDRDGVLHDAAFVFVPIDHGRWLLDHVRPAPRLERRVIRPPPAGIATPPASAGPADPSSAPLAPSSPAEPKDGDAR
jgi:conjugal transfer pilus assembly protein TraV